MLIGVPNLFQVFNCWFNHPNFVYFVEGVWSSNKIYGKSAFLIKGNLKLSRDNLSKWNVEVFGMIN